MKLLFGVIGNSFSILMMQVLPFLLDVRVKENLKLDLKRMVNVSRRQVSSIKCIREEDTRALISQHDK